MTASVRRHQPSAVLAQASQPGVGPREWSTATVPSFVGIWWFAWIVGGMLERLANRITMRNPELASVGMSLEVLASILVVIAGVLAIKVQRSVHDRLEAKAAQRAFE